MKATDKNIKPEEFCFKDDGKIPNSKLPLLLYRNVFQERGNEGANLLENLFVRHNWTNFWTNGILPYHHYHSNTHEVLGIYQGSGLLHVGGENGDKIQVKAGDIIVIPAGVGHKNLDCSGDFGVAGAYPDGRDYDLLAGKPEERPLADENIKAVPLPEFDPVLGKNEGLLKIWN